MSLTPAQQQAAAARGNVLVIAGAGTGKTKTLVERCLSLILDGQPPVSIEEILMVTFTDAAAAEMRKRIRTRLEEESSGDRRQRCLEQLALLDSAFIGTIHSFCFKLARQHFYELEIDPQAAVMPKEESDLLANEPLLELLNRRYAGKDATSDAVRELARVHGNGSDESIRAAILRIHHYTQTLPDPEGWFDREIECLQKTSAADWRAMLMAEMPELQQAWLRELDAAQSGNPVAAACLDLIRGLDHASDLDAVAVALESAMRACETPPKGRKTACLEPIAKFRKDADFLLPLLQKPDMETDPLKQDWEWFREPMLTLTRVAREFSDAFGKAKREAGLLDFHDLEQHALRLLWDLKADQPAPFAREWRDRLKFIFVDEYQDINKAQDRIIAALSRDGSGANRFLVGDVKQSIYRFRLASPDIFRAYARTWRPPQATAISLADNFRSRESIIAITNDFFGFLMTPEAGGIDYAGQALRFGAAESRGPLSSSADAIPRVEMHHLLKENDTPEEDDATGDVADMLEAEKEARLVGLRLIQLVRSAEPVVWDEQLGRSRPARWSDIAVLLRAPAKKAGSFSKAFSQLDIPLEVARRGFYDTTEIADLRALLQILDNPLQDVPLLAVLHSPIGNMSAGDLAGIRMAARKTRFFAALSHCSGAGGPVAQKAKSFMERFPRWRRLARQAPLSTCLETILADTHYCEWLASEPRGAQRRSNVQRFVALARDFDQFQRRGLTRFLSFLDAQRESDVEPAVAANSASEAVALMSIHQSKGLEFPIVILPDLGKAFNEGDLRGRLLLSEALGICSDIKPPGTRLRYPSLPLWLARRRERREMLGEELRLLYVGMTRARDLLIMTAGLTEKKLDGVWKNEKADVSALDARCGADWLGFWCAKRGFIVTPENCPIHLRRWTDADLAKSPEPAAARQDITTEHFAPGSLLQKLSWTYPHLALTTEPAKTSVSALRRRASDAEGETPSYSVFRAAVSGGLSGAERGSAHHAFLEQMRLDRPFEVGYLREEAARLVSCGALDEARAAALNLEGIAAFWSSDQGEELLANRDRISRELPFTARMSPAGLSAIMSLNAAQVDGAEFVVVQGVADLAAIFPDQIWLYDFKTDRIKPGALDAKVEFYKPQLAIYSKALSQAYNRPVTRGFLYFIEPRRLASVPT